MTKSQSGFRSKFSTDTCIIGLTDYIKGKIAKGRVVGMVLLDLQKAFVSTMEYCYVNWMVWAWGVLIGSGRISLAGVSVSQSAEKVQISSR